MRCHRTRTALRREPPNRREYARYPKHIYSNQEHINNFDLFSIRRLFKGLVGRPLRGEVRHLQTYAAVVVPVLGRRSLEGDYGKIYFREVERPARGGRGRVRGLGRRRVRGADSSTSTIRR